MFDRSPRHFLTGSELSARSLNDLLNLADILRNERNDRQNRRPLSGRHVALLFEKPSLRTRVSFTIAVQELGGQVVELTSMGRKKEEPEDTIRVLQGYVDACMLRCHEHSILEKMVKHSRIPVINGLSDSHHPCQALADLLTLKQNFGELRGLNLCYVGDGNNVLHSLLMLAPLVGVNVRYACPRGYGPNAFIVQSAKNLAGKEGGQVTAFADPVSAVRGADAIYTDVWTSMGFEQEETDRDKIFAPYQLNQSLYEASGQNPLIMHCMPMIRGKEITAAMVDHEKSVLFQQSENRLHAQKALLMTVMEH